MSELSTAEIERIIVIGCGNDKGIRSFAKETGFPKEELLADPTLKCY